MGIVSAEAHAAGVASMPEPFTDADWGGWIMWRAFSFVLEFNDATGLQFLNWNLEIDSKAMRRMGANEVLVSIAESQSAAFNIAIPTRTLVKLS